ncbi:MAG: type 1 glutamine amidotransferase [Bacteroidetes bacterium]|nr:MAG: type 1 glutamine amidotransferase [Bacteroidota bacterium]
MRKLKSIYGLVLFASVLLLGACQTEPQLIETPHDERIRVAVLVAEGFHDGEAFMPIGYLVNQGFDVTVIGPERGTVKAYNSDFTITIEKAVGEVLATDFQALVLPGGRGPAVLRENDEIIHFVSEFWQTGRVTAAICHGPQVLISANLMDGRTSTGIGGIKDELEEAGVNYVDQSVVIDGNLITSRMPDDLYDFSQAIAEELKQQVGLTLLMKQ